MAEELSDTQSEEVKEFFKRRLTESGISYSAVAVLLVLLSLLVNSLAQAIGGEEAVKGNAYLYVSYLVPQFVLLAAAALYFIRSKEPLKCALRPSRVRYFPIALLLQFGLLFSLSELNGLFLSLLGLIGYQSSEASTIPALDGWNLLPAILVIALLPAVLEELFFRGVLSRTMHESGWGMIPTVLIAGGMFALYHGNPEQTVYQFLCGICFTLVALRAGSIFPTMLAHFLNNALILILASCGLGELSSLPVWGYALLLTASGLCFAGVMIYLVFFDQSGNGKGERRAGGFLLGAACGIAVFATQWIALFVQGFFRG